MDRTGTLSCPVMGFGISGALVLLVQCSVYACFRSELQIIIFNWNTVLWNSVSTSNRHLPGNLENKVSLDQIM